MREVEVYDVLNKHFNKKYELLILMRAFEVFSACALYDAQRAKEEGAEPVLGKLCATYPDFARHYLVTLRKMNQGNFN